MKKYKYIGMFLVLLNFGDMNQVKANPLDVSMVIEYIQLQEINKKDKKLDKTIGRRIVKNTNSEVHKRSSDSVFIVSTHWLFELLSWFNFYK